MDVNGDPSYHGNFAEMAERRVSRLHDQLFPDSHVRLVLAPKKNLNGQNQGVIRPHYFCDAFPSPICVELPRVLRLAAGVSSFQNAYRPPFSRSTFQPSQPFFPAVVPTSASASLIFATVH